MWCWYSSVNYAIIGSYNDLSHVRCQAIDLTNDCSLSIGPLGINFNNIWVKISHFSYMIIVIKRRLQYDDNFLSWLQCVEGKYASVLAIMRMYSTIYIAISSSRVLVNTKMRREVESHYITSVTLQLTYHRNHNLFIHCYVTFQWFTS